jgi:hypothetical protein
MRRPMFALVLVLALAAACGRKSEAPKASAGSGASSEEATAGDPCSLLEPAEVAAAIGPLAGAPYRGTFAPEADNSSCRYDTKDHRRLLLDVDWTGGAQVMKMSHSARSLTDKAMQGETKAGVTVLKSGDTLSGEWDEIAAAPVVCCALDVLRGDQHLRMDWAGTRLTPITAAALLNLALKRLDHPLAISGSAGMASAQARYAAQAKDTLIDACTLVSQKDAEAIIGVPLVAPPDHGDPASNRACYYRIPLPGPNPSHAKLEYVIEIKQWHDAYANFTEDQAMIVGVSAGLRRQIAQDTTTKAAANAPPPGPWDAEGPAIRADYEAVKGDLMITATTTGEKKKAEAMLAKAVSALPASP